MRILKGEENEKSKFCKKDYDAGNGARVLVASNVTRVEAAPNNLTPEQIEAIATEMFNRFAAFDAQGTADMLFKNPPSSSLK